MAGHIKLDRRILEWEWYQEANVCRLFIHLLLTANYKESRWKGMVILRGQVVIGRKALAETLHLSEQQIRTALSKLILTNEITTKSTNHETIVTICKYDTYQSFSEQNDQESTSKSTNKITNHQPTDNQRITTSNKDNNYKEYKEVNTKGDFFQDFSLPIELKFYWEEWVEYKRKQHKFAYKDVKYEASAVRELLKVSGGNLPTAIEVIKQSISNGWKGFFPLKNNANTTNADKMVL